MKFLKFCDNSLTIVSESPKDTFVAGRALGELLYPGLLIMLKGELGAGKTCFVQGIGDALGYGRVKSPTFVIMNEYEAKVPFLHVDLYRLENEDEIEALGIEEYLEDGFAAAVEWAERWQNSPEDRLEVEFSPVTGDDAARIISFEIFGAHEKELIAAIKEKLFYGVAE